jgi:enoyl-CoA hydratase
MGAFRIDRDERGTHVVFDDGRMNLLSADRLRELAALVSSIDHSSAVVTFRSGRSGLFAAGADMDEMSRFDGADAERFSALGQSLFNAIEQLPMPTIALIDGDCYGGALDLSLAFDLRFATRRSRFAHPGARIGIVTGSAGTVRLQRILGHHELAQLLLANEVLDADSAARLGLIDFTLEELDGSEAPLLARVASTDREAYRVAKELLVRHDRMPVTSLQLLARRLHDLYSGSSAWMS